MRYDFSPLYRSTVGFDRVFDLLAQADRVETAPNWPPYNIERTDEDGYRITMAVAGFAEDELQLVQQGNVLLVSGQRQSEADATHVLHRGIASRTFRQTFNLADHVVVSGAGLTNGLLTIDLRREIPEALKPRRIQIASGSNQATLTQDNALGTSAGEKDHAQAA